MRQQAHCLNLLYTRLEALCRLKADCHFHPQVEHRILQLCWQWKRLCNWNHLLLQNRYMHPKNRSYCHPPLHEKNRNRFSGKHRQHLQHELKLQIHHHQFHQLVLRHSQLKSHLLLQWRKQVQTQHLLRSLCCNKIVCQKSVRLNRMKLTPIGR